jgi:hypothetical protein
MSEVRLIRTGEEGRKARWLLFLDEDEVVLTDSHGDEVTSFPAAAADQRFRLPSVPSTFD